MENTEIESFIERILKYGLLTEDEVSVVCFRVMDIMVKESNIRCIDLPVNVVGDLHGQFVDLLTVFHIKGTPASNSYVFLGDYVDRGENSLELILLLMCYKILYPEAVTLLRGNHEQASINKVYGFYDECVTKYGNSVVWSMINEVFSFFNIGCVIDGRYLCVHGGISPRVTLQRLNRIDRFEPIGEDCILTDVLWSDPFYKLGASCNPRGSGYLFGEDVLKQFLMHNNLEMLIRSHQLAIEGYKWDFGNLCLTVWSAPNYMGKCSNPASFLVVMKDVPISTKCLRLFKKAK